MLKSKGETCMVEEPSNVKQLSLNHVCKIGLNIPMQRIVRAKGRKQASKDSKHIYEIRCEGKLLDPGFSTIFILSR